MVAGSSGRRNQNGERSVCRSGCSTANDERAEWPLLYRNSRIGWVSFYIIKIIQLHALTESVNVIYKICVGRRI